MASHNLNLHSNTKLLKSQFTCFPYLGVHFNIHPRTRTVFTETPSNFSETSTDSLLSPNWTTGIDVQLADHSVSNEENDSVSSSSNLLKSSKKIQKENKENSSPKEARRRPNRRRNDWRPQEDAKLLELMKEYGQCWAMISSKLPGRTGKQVRDRYVNNLAPGIKCGNWTPEEDRIILSLCGEKGNKWSLIAARLPGRTEAQVKNRFYSCIKKKSTNSFNASLENNSSPQTSSEIDFEDENFENDCNAFIESSDFVLRDSDVKEVDNQYICVTPNVGSMTDEERMSYGNIIRIPCFTGRPETLLEPLENPLFAGSRNNFGPVQEEQPVMEDFFSGFIENEYQVDEWLNHAVDCVIENEESDPYDIEKYFAEDLNQGEGEFKTLGEIEYEPSDREMKLRKKKSQLEMMLAAVMKEIEDL